MPLLISVFKGLRNEVWNITGYENLNPPKRFEGESNTGRGTLPNGTYYYVLELEEENKSGFFVLTR
jgi:hypothetical protein